MREKMWDAEEANRIAESGGRASVSSQGSPAGPFRDRRRRGHLGRGIRVADGPVMSAAR